MIKLPARDIAELRRYIGIAAIPMVAVLLMLALQDWINERFHEQWNWAYYHFGNDLYKKRFFYGMLPVPFAFLLWLKALEKQKRFTLHFNPIATLISLSGFIAIYWVHEHPWRLEAAFDIGVIAGLFIWIPFKTWVKRAAHQPRMALIALIAASAAWDYYFLMGRFFSHTILTWTTDAAVWLLNALGLDVFASENMDYRLAFNVLSANFKIIMAPFCGGLEGIFLFCFLLSMAFLLDWQRFSHRRLLPFYVAGILAMFAANVVRIAGLFSLGHWIFMPGQSEWIREWGNTPIDLFHSYIGWLLDLIVFGLFALWMYRRRTTPSNPEASKADA